MASFENKLKDVIIKLHEIEALKFGMFKMKVGIESPVYVDLRSVISYPEILENIADLMWEFAALRNIECDQLCGVPYAALPIAALMSSRSKIPMVMRRKEAKKYGTKKLIEGKFNPGDNCVIVEDVVTSGSSVLETVVDLHSEGLNVTSVLVVVDREQGGSHNLSEKGVAMNSLCTLSKILQVLKEAGQINQDVVDSVRKYIAASQIHPDGTFLTPQPRTENVNPSRLTLPFTARADQAVNPVAAKLLKVMVSKQSNLCVAADVTSASRLISLAESAGPYVCLFKTHIDIVEDFSPQLIQDLLAAAQKHNFLLMEDRKFADIGHTVSLQYSQGIHKISSWADLVTVHPIPASMEISKKHPDFVAGIVCQTSGTVQNPGLLQLTPGVSLDCQNDGHLGQQYNSPEDIVMSRGADIAVVGRGIIQATDPAQAAQEYRAKLWAAYEKRVSSVKNV
ncbi:uridine 5'-monophosphate synthase isoform X2 [Cryptotermes secundus]|uniref:uridine 5'-monophosphate synthase isoform X2 n=1 Tax=Cryptotermes secundus TaxID=105785 RepID=UPI000CD7B758|nr:uridine 5'-monophosphate synthase isoform X2 [Cryptotermes secundus]